jgi:hypothetical protein
MAVLLSFIMSAGIIAVALLVISRSIAQENAADVSELDRI